MKALVALIAFGVIASIQADTIALEPPIVSEIMKNDGKNEMDQMAKDTAEDALELAPYTDYEMMINDVINEMGQIAKDAAVALQHSLEDIALDHQVEEILASIDARRNESEACVAAEDENVIAIVDTMYQNVSSCGVVAAKTSANIVSDINAATQQLVFGGYDVLRTYRKCKSHKNPILSSICYSHLTIKATFYVANARKSIKTIRESKNERIPAVAADYKACMQSAGEVAINGLNDIQTSIDDCIGKHH